MQNRILRTIVIERVKSSINSIGFRNENVIRIVDPRLIGAENSFITPFRIETDVFMIIPNLI